MTAVIQKLEKDNPILDHCRGDVLDASSEVWAGWWGGDLAVIWGIAPGSALSETAFVWARTTEIVKKCPKALLKLSRVWLAEMGKDYTSIVGLCDRKTRWVEHLDANWTPGIEGYDRFEIKVR